MKRRIVSIICIMFLLFTITSPISGSIFSYADEPQQEQLSQDEVIKAAIALYLNERKAWITSTTSAPIDAVQAQMQAWIDTYDFWTNHTTIGSAAAFYAQCVVKYNPFRISLKGPAVRALNDLYNWLIDSGKLPNLDSDNSGGETTDNLYNGYITGDSLYYITEVGSRYPNSENFYLAGNLSNLTYGIPVRGTSYDILLNHYLNYNHATLEEFNDINNDDFSNDSYGDINYFSDYSRNVVLNRYVGGGIPTLNIVNPQSAESINLTGNSSVYPGNARNIYSTYNNTRGNPAYLMLTSNGVNRCYCGFICIRSDYFSMWGFHRITVEGNSQVKSANVNLDTDNFNKTDPTPPDGENEVTYTPEDKTTGNTYNTYNEYITNYVTKNTVVNKSDDDNGGGGGSDPDEPETPGGTTPPWDNSGTAGTLTPDGNGGYNFNLPDLTLPDLNIDWTIKGLKEKFPFSIPWDLLAFFTVLNAEPETPAIEAQIDLGIVDWDIDWDLHNFDTLAALLRNLEFIGFCLALILITRSIIKG